MAILTWPASLPPANSARLGLSANTQSGGRSPFDGTEQTLALPGSRWVAELRWTNLHVAQWRVMQAFIANLGGRAGRFTWGPSHMPRRGTRTAPGNVTIAGGQAGGFVLTNGWATSGPAAFVAGDLISWVDPTGRDVFHMVTADVLADGSGNCSLPIAPALRRTPSAATVVNLTTPKAVWRLVNDEVSVEYEPGVIASVTLSIEEAIF